VQDHNSRSLTYRASQAEPHTLQNHLYMCVNAASQPTQSPRPTQCMSQAANNSTLASTHVNHCLRMTGLQYSVGASTTITRSQHHRPTWSQTPSPVQPLLPEVTSQLTKAPALRPHHLPQALQQPHHPGPWHILMPVDCAD